MTWQIYVLVAVIVGIWYVVVRQVAERRRWSRQQYHVAFWFGTIGLSVLVLYVVR